MNPNALVEAVPNFAEGRRPAVIDAIADALQSAGAHLLDRTSDWDHHRSVLTIAGSPTAVVEGLFRGVEMAARHIDLFSQRGAHPRMGAADVVPLVPLRHITLEECVGLARVLGRRVGDELGLPVYLYEAAATRPERRNLADVRRGEFEGLLATIHMPERAPDFGPAQVGPAGAVIIGARPILIAYNIFLETNDVTIAQSIAKRIRARNGGFPAVKALGLLIDGQAQVSMNLVDYTQTPIHVVFDAITRLAHDHGVKVARSELIGLAPDDALLQAAAHYLQLPTLATTNTIEGALQRAMLD
ncbi:MAG: glutamate formimidoyltransferase [Caldilineaceae bacterium]|nr:glutamate formimidoyltransferase [Caldilineaceae bacterium]